MTSSELINAIDLYSKWWKKTRVHPKDMPIARYQKWLRKVLGFRLLDKLSLSETGKRCGVTPERIRQIEFQFRRVASRRYGLKLFDWKTYRKITNDLAEVLDEK